MVAPALRCASPLTALILTCTIAAPLAAADWPCWLGPLRNGSSPETGLLTTWPKEGPKLLWKVAGGDGYSSVAVAQGRAVTLVQHDDADFVLALDAVKGTKLWETKVGASYKNSYGNGPRSTPTIDGKNIYVQLPNGPLACLDAEKGTIVWSVDLFKEFGSKNISWGLSASPLIEGDLVYALPGGHGAGVVALNKLTGKLAWKTGDDRPGYATPMPITVAGVRSRSSSSRPRVCCRPVRRTARNSGACPGKPSSTATSARRCRSARNCSLSASGEEVGCAMYKLSGAGPEPLWQSKGKKSVMMNYWANAVAS